MKTSNWNFVKGSELAYPYFENTKNSKMIISVSKGESRPYIFTRELKNGNLRFSSFATFENAVKYANKFVK